MKTNPPNINEGELSKATFERKLAHV